MQDGTVIKVSFHHCLLQIVAMFHDQSTRRKKGTMIPRNEGTNERTLFETGYELGTQACLKLFHHTINWRNKIYGAIATLHIHAFE